MVGLEIAMYQTVRRSDMNLDTVYLWGIFPFHWFDVLVCALWWWVFQTDSDFIFDTCVWSLTLITRVFLLLLLEVCNNFGCVGGHFVIIGHILFNCVIIINSNNTHVMCSDDILWFGLIGKQLNIYFFICCYGHWKGKCLFNKILLMHDRFQWPLILVYQSYLIIHRH